MVEESHSGKCHYHTVLITALDNEVVADRSAGLGDVLNAALLSALDIVAEGEEGIRAERYAVDGIEVSSLLLLGEGSGLLGEILLPISVSANVFFVLVDVAVNNVVAFGTAKSVFKGKV